MILTVLLQLVQAGTEQALLEPVAPSGLLTAGLLLLILLSGVAIGWALGRR